LEKGVFSKGEIFHQAFGLIRGTIVDENQFEFGIRTVGIGQAG